MPVWRPDNADHIPLQGNLCYTPSMTHDPSSNEPAASGYSPRSELVWANARHDYDAGLSASDVCARYDLSLSTFRDRARREGWRRAVTLGDARAPWTDEDEEDLDTDPIAMAHAAWRHAARAVAQGDRHAARTWTRLASELRVVATDSLDEAARALYAEKVRAKDALSDEGVDADALEAELAGQARAEPPRDTVRRAVAARRSIAFARGLIRPRVAAAFPEPHDSHHSHRFSPKAAAAAAPWTTTALAACLPPDPAPAARAEARP